MQFRLQNLFALLAEPLAALDRAGRRLALLRDELDEICGELDELDEQLQAEMPDRPSSSDSEACATSVRGAVAATT